jgi:hypothetical protein
MDRIAILQCRHNDRVFFLERKRSEEIVVSLFLIVGLAAFNFHGGLSIKSWPQG